ncbi:hypothetical protein ACFL20_05980 [Spirochaetota bacterium]
MQKDIDSNHSDVNISILGINYPGLGNNEAFCEGSDLPWLLDTEEAYWWGSWGVAYRDVVILNGKSAEAGVFNLTEHDLQLAEEYNALKTLLLNIVVK